MTTERAGDRPRGAAHASEGELGPESCRRCGEVVPAGANFCPNCGAPVSISAASERRVVSVVFDSSTVMTPSPPTFSIASAISSPIAVSLCAEIVATCAFSLRLLTGFAWLVSALTATSSPRSSPRFKSIALAPAATLRTPSA